MAHRLGTIGLDVSYNFANWWRISARVYSGFLRCFRDPNLVHKIKEKHHRLPRIRQNRVPRIREIGPLESEKSGPYQVPSIFLKKTWSIYVSNNQGCGVGGKMSISTGIPNLGVWCKNNSIGLSKSDKKPTPCVVRNPTPCDYDSDTSSVTPLTSRVARWPVLHRPGRYFTADLAEAGKKTVFWKPVPEAGILKINNLP